MDDMVISHQGSNGTYLTLPSGLGRILNIRFGILRTLGHLFPVGQFVLCKLWALMGDIASWAAFHFPLWPRKVIARKSVHHAQGKICDVSRIYLFKHLNAFFFCRSTRLPHIRLSVKR